MWVIHILTHCLCSCSNESSLKRFVQLFCNSMKHVRVCYILTSVLRFLLHLLLQFTCSDLYRSVIFFFTFWVFIIMRSFRFPDNSVRLCNNNIIINLKFALCVVLCVFYWKVVAIDTSYWIFAVVCLSHSQYTFVPSRRSVSCGGSGCMCHTMYYLTVNCALTHNKKQLFQWGDDMNPFTQSHARNCRSCSCFIDVTYIFL